MYTQNGTQVVSDCSKTLTGWYHEDNQVPPKQWGCFQAAKSASAENAIHVYEIAAPNNKQQASSCPYAFAKKLNAKQSAWIAGVYDTIDMKQYMPRVKPDTFRVDARKKHMAKFMNNKMAANKENGFPDYLDWRNRTGVSFVNAVRNQGNFVLNDCSTNFVGKCGSCYAFSTMAMLESRARIATDNQWQPVFAPQTIVSCDMHYSQGCDGGFPYLVAKYTQDFGIVQENCNPYNGSQIPCVDLCPAYQKTYVASYEYVGGYYGASSMDNMMYTIMQSGPITVGIEVYRDLFYYKGGVYHHVADLQDNSFEVLNHAVVITGWGITSDGEKYWIVRNSWGETVREHNNVVVLTFYSGVLLDISSSVEVLTNVLLKVLLSMLLFCIKNCFVVASDYRTRCILFFKNAHTARRQDQIGGVKRKSILLSRRCTH